jgi:alpha-1,2-mannosyltransferase
MRKGTQAAWLLVCGLVALQLLHFGSLVVGDPDEGVYVYAGRLIAGGLLPYRDFMLAHPPLLPGFVAVVWKVIPDLVAVRGAYLVLVSVLGLCTFGLVRQITTSSEAGLAALGLQTLGMLCVANMGRTVRLEPLMVLLVMAGAWSAVRSELPRWRMLTGVFLALALLVKFTAAAIAGPFVLGFLWFEQSDWHHRVRALGWMTLGAALVLVPTLAWLLLEPGFVRWALQGQMMRPRIGLGLRVTEFVKVCVRYPPVVLGMFAAIRILLPRQQAMAGARALAFAGLACTLLLVFAFKSFYAYYAVAALPLLTSCLAIEAARYFRARPAWLHVRLWTPAVICSVVLVACFAYVESFYRLAKNHSVHPARVLALLKDRPGPVYTMIPDFVLWTGQELPGGYYTVDSYLPRLVGVLGDADMEEMLTHVNAAVVSPVEFNDCPRTTALLKREFRRAYADKDYELWVRARTLGS